MTDRPQGGRDGTFHTGVPSGTARPARLNRKIPDAATKAQKLINKHFCKESFFFFKGENLTKDRKMRLKK